MRSSIEKWKLLLILLALAQSNAYCPFSLPWWIASRAYWAAFGGSICSWLQIQIYGTCTLANWGVVHRLLIRLLPSWTLTVCMGVSRHLKISLPQHLSFSLRRTTSQLEHFCNNQTCPDTVSKLNASNCCVWHANIHTCHPSVTVSALGQYPLYINGCVSRW